VGDRLGGPVADPLGGLPVGILAEGLLEAGVDRPEVNPQAGQQLLVGGLRSGQDPLGDQPVDPGPDGCQVQAVGHQHPGGQVVALGEQAHQQVLGAEVLVAEAPGLHAGEPGGSARRPGDVHRPRDRFPCPSR